MSQVARPFLIDNGLVQETRTDVNSDYLSMELLDAPEGTYDINVQVVFGLDGVDAPMNMTIHVVPGPTIFVDPEAATRVSLFR